MTDAIKIEFQNNIDEVVKQFPHFNQEKREEALAKGLIDIGYIGRFDLLEKTKKSLHKPTRFTLGSFLVQTGKGYTPLRKSDWKNVRNNSYNVYLRIKDDADVPGSATPPAKYLFNLIEGGPRSAKSGERQLRTSVLGPKDFMIPGRSFVDADGNIMRGIMQQVLADTRTQASAGYQSVPGETRLRRAKRRVRRNAGLKEFVYMTPKGGRKAPGVYERFRGVGEKQMIRPVLLKTSKTPTYKKGTFPFYRIIQNFLNRRGESILLKSFLKLDK